MELNDAFLELTSKLNESSFKPILRRMSDWAFEDNLDVTNEKDPQHARIVIFSITMSRLIQHFKVSQGVIERKPFHTEIPLVPHDTIPRRDTGENPGCTEFIWRILSARRMERHQESSNFARAASSSEE
jgi:hypothetical protein